MRALLVANQLDTDAGYIGNRFRHHGYAFSECHREALSDWPALDGSDLVLLLGSEWSVYWEDNAASVKQESMLVREAHDRGVPVFGICYGSQLIAHALGGTVEKAREHEIGWMDITSDVPEVIVPGPWMQWHYDCFTPPPGADELGRSAVGSQIIRLGRTFATQFHPEVDESIVTYWANSDGGRSELAKHGMSPEALIDDTRRHVAESKPNAERIVDWFLDHVAGS
jgi:GMP synthase-like glutamine amidotransferase